MSIHYSLDIPGLEESWFKHYPPTRTWSLQGSRPEEILKRLPTDRPIRGVEVGVHRGWNAAILLKERPLLHLTMVDIWLDEDPKQEALKATEFAADRRRVMHMSSVEAAKVCKDERFDFVFIDGDHEYEAVRADILAWAEVCDLVSGHDFKSITLGYVTMFNGVARAVYEISQGFELGGDQTWFAK